MILIDTNVISEMMAPDPHARVSRWMSEQDSRRIGTTAITTAEIFSGIAQLPAGRRRADLEDRFVALLERVFADRILEFSFAASRHYGAIVAARKAMGRPIPLADALIAAIARRHEASIATRNVNDFEGLAIPLVDPFRY